MTTTKTIHTSISLHHTGALRAEHGRAEPDINWLNLYITAKGADHHDFHATIFLDDALYAARLAQAINEAWAPPAKPEIPHERDVDETLYQAGVVEAVEPPPFPGIKAYRFRPAKDETP